jgi:hypothetical protein
VKSRARLRPVQESRPYTRVHPAGSPFGIATPEGESGFAGVEGDGLGDGLADALGDDVLGLGALAVGCDGPPLVGDGSAAVEQPLSRAAATSDAHTAGAAAPVRHIAARRTLGRGAGRPGAREITCPACQVRPRPCG